MDLGNALPSIVVFCVVLAGYLFVRSRRLSQEKSKANNVTRGTSR